MQTSSAPSALDFVPPSDQQESPWAFLAFAWRRKLLVVLCLGCALALGYVHFLRQTPIYRSSSQILMVKRGARLPVRGVEIDTSYDPIHETMLRSPIVIGDAIKKHGLGELPSLMASSDPTSTVISGLSVSGSGSPTGDIIRFSYESTVREDCPIVLRAIIQEYQEFIGQTYRNVSQDTIDLIEKAKDELDRQITETEEKYRKFRYEVPLLFTGDTALNVHETRLTAIEGYRSSAVLENSRLQAKIDAIEAALARGGSRDALAMTLGAGDSGDLDGLGTENSLEDQLFPLVIEEQMLLDTHGPDHPRIKAIRKRMDLTRDYMLRRFESDNVGDTDAESPRGYYEVYVESLREQIRVNEQTIAEMTTLFDEEREKAKSLSTFQVADEMYKSEIERKERMFDAVINRLEEVNLVNELSESGEIKSQVIHPPMNGSQVEPDMKRIMVTSTLLGLVAGFGLAFVVDSADRRFRSPDDIRADLGLPVLAHIPVIPMPKKSKNDLVPESGEVLHPVLRVVHRPMGQIAEAYRAVRTAMYFSTRGGGHQVIQITSPNPGDGKTTLSANLAASIAQSGKKCLLIDADFRKPRIHKLFGMKRKVGLADLIAGTCEISDAVQNTQVDNLQVLACGPRPDNPSELLTSIRFQELLDLLREQFDIVIVDTPPVLAVTDPAVVAPRVDGVMVVMRLSTSARHAARRALETLDSVGGTVLGVIVNGVASSPGYGYNSKGYGGYGYGGYGNGGYASYGYSDRSGYYEDDTVPASTK